MDTIATTTAVAHVPALPADTVSYALQTAPDASGSAGTYATITGQGNITAATAVTLTGLSAATFRWARLVATNAIGSTNGAGVRFETLPVTPTVTLEVEPNEVIISAVSLGATSFKFERATVVSGTPGAYSTLATQASGNYIDNTAVNGTTYSYRITAYVGSDASTPTLAQGTPAPIAPDKRIFSTGQLIATLGVGGDAQEFTIGTVQNADLDWAWAEKLLYGAAGFEGRYPIGIGHHTAAATIKIGSAELHSAALQILMASAMLAAGTGGLSGQNVISSDGTMTEPSFKAVFTAHTSDGKNVIVTYNSVTAKGVSWPFKLGDFMVNSFDLMAIPDASGNLGTIQVQI